jgi:DNA-binding LytR/AlgR family response regulator
MPSAVIADDEPLLRRELAEALADLWPELEVVGECGDGAVALRTIEALQPAVCFLDIRMPKLNGLEVAERVQGISQLVFVTAYDEHAIAAFEHGAADYVLKPIKRLRLAATVQRLKDRLGAGSAQREGRSAARLERIQATVGNTLRFFAVGDICYCRADGKYTKVVTVDAEALIRRSLSGLMENLDPTRFWRIHRAIIVNVEHIDRVVREEGGQMWVHLRNGRGSFAVSKAHQAQFRGM